MFWSHHKIKEWIYWYVKVTFLVIKYNLKQVAGKIWNKDLSRKTLIILKKMKHWSLQKNIPRNVTLYFCKKNEMLVKRWRRFFSCFSHHSCVRLFYYWCVHGSVFEDMVNGPLSCRQGGSLKRGFSVIDPELMVTTMSFAPPSPMGPYRWMRAKTPRTTSSTEELNFGFGKTQKQGLPSSHYGF